MECLICGCHEEGGKNFSNHVKREHGLTSEAYTIRHLCGGKRPTCIACGVETRYVSFLFKKYCKEHARLAMKSAGSQGGKAQAWNKGLTQATDERIRRRAVAQSGEGNPFHGHNHTEASLQKMRQSKAISRESFEGRLAARSAEFEALTTYDEYFSRQKQYLSFRCVACGEEQPKTLQAFERGSRCYRCHPFSKSNWELEVFDFVRQHSTDAVSGDRTVLSPKEIDVYVPSRNLGIECHGLYWHSEFSPDGVVDQNLTLKKIVTAAESNVRLVQFFDDEWRDRRTICESMILHRLGVSPTRHYARKCDVVQLDSRQQREFFDTNHLAGYTPASRAWGLRMSGDLVAALSIRKPRHGRKYRDMMEVARFATASRTAVVGGLARLLSYVDGNLMTYVDRRVGDGAGYEACGFKKIGQTGIDYWYTDGVLRYDRFKYRAQGNLSEKAVSLAAGVSRIWGCGSLVMMR